MSDILRSSVCEIQTTITHFSANKEHCPAHTLGLHSHQTIMEDTHNRYFTIILSWYWCTGLALHYQGWHHPDDKAIEWLQQQQSLQHWSTQTACGLQRMMLPHWLCNRRHGDHAVSLKNQGYHNWGSSAATLLLAEHMIFMYTYCYVELWNGHGWTLHHWKVQDRTNV